MKKNEIKKLLNHLGINNPDVEIYSVDDDFSVISHFNNGKYYNFYNVKSDDSEMTGPYDNLEEAQSFLLAKFADAILIYKYKEQEEKASSELFEWRLNFYLSDPIDETHFEDAANYLAEDNMSQYYDLRNKRRFKSIKYILTTCESGYIEIVTDTNKLSKNAKMNFINWINDFQDSALNAGVENQYWAKIEYDWSNCADDEELISYEFIRICNIDEEDDLEFIGEKGE